MWLSDNSDTSSFMINGYTLISQGKICTAHGGLAIYLCNKYDYNSINIYHNSHVLEGQFIEIIGKQLDKKVILGNIYIDHPGITMKHVRHLLMNLFLYLIIFKNVKVKSSSLLVTTILTYCKLKKMQYLANILILLLLKVFPLKLHYPLGSRVETVCS